MKIHVKYTSCLLLGGVAGLLPAYSYAWQVNDKCIITCNGVNDCNAGAPALKACYDRENAKRRAENEEKQKEWERQNQAKIDAAKKIEEANEALRQHQ